MGQFEKAAPLLKDVCDVRRRILGPVDPTTLASISALGIFYQRMGFEGDGERWREMAEAALVEAFAGRRALLGPKHPDTLETMRGLCQLKGQMGDRTGMQQLMEDELVPPGLSPRVALETVPVPISTRICCGPRIGWH
jgi:hypothetical protein